MNVGANVPQKAPLGTSCCRKTNKKQRIFSEKLEGFRDGLSYSTPQKSKEPSLGPIHLKI